MRREDELVIIGAGLPRTGTTTLQHVLRDLLGKPCYHMDEVFNNQDGEFWISVHKGEKKSKEEWKKILKGYCAATDTPVCLFVKELMEVYPNAKVLLSVRDPDQWYESVISTTVAITKLRNTWRGRLFCNIITPKYNTFPELAIEAHKGFAGDNWQEERKEDYIYGYRKHIEEIKRIVPEEKLFIYDVREGYAPLCKFLDVPKREGSLPRFNDSVSFHRRLRFLRFLYWGLIIAIPGVVGISAWMFSRLF